MKVIFSRNQSISQISSMVFGHFLEHFHRQVYGGVYDPESRFADEDGFRTDVLDAMRAVRTPIIRWPGGCYVSAYDWHCGVGKNRIPTYDKAWRVEESHAFGTDEFVTLCRKLGCEPYICTNAGTGTAEDMSDWVEYCNLKSMGRFAKERIANGYPEPHNIRFWSIGNENYGPWELGARDPGEWGRLVRESAKMMLRVDPTIELSAASANDMNWGIQLLRAAGEYMDWISIHQYWDFSPDGLTYADYDTVMLRTGEDLTGNIDRTRAYLTACGMEKRIKIAFDEWNLRGWYHPHVMDIWYRDVKRHEDADFYRNEVIGPRAINDNNVIYTMADAVFSACFLNACIKNSDLVGMACFSPIVNTRGAIFTHKDGIVLRPQYFVFALYANLLKKTALKTWCESIPTISGKDGSLTKTVDAVDLAVTCDDTGYAVAAVNKDRFSAQSVDLCSLDDALSEIRIHTLNGPSPDSYNDIDRTEVGVTSSDWMPFTGRVTLPPHSVSVIELR